MARTTSVVQRAATTWAQIFDLPIPEFVGDRENCTKMSKSVKSFLSSCPSKVESQVLAFQSIKKLLPASCKCMEEGQLRGLAACLTRGKRSLPKGYQGFVRNKVRSLFRKGWDSGLYSDFCYSAAPGLSATTDSTRRFGGALGAFEGEHLGFLDATLVGGYETEVSGQLMVVQSAGKPRALTKFASSDFCLEPLHKSAYAILSRTRWLMRGDPTAEKLRTAGFKRSGGTLVSGDYRSATDNLPVEVAEWIMEEVLENSVSIPDSVKNHAMKALRPRLWNLDYDLDFTVTRGQMMGSYNSFWLLCVQNYVAVEWARKQAGLKAFPLQINGDDILFQVNDRSFFETWVDVVSTLGLEVEKTKTSVSSEYGTLNSTLFEWSGDYLVVVPTLRFGMLRAVDYPHSLGSTLDKFVAGQSPDVKWRAARAFFSWHLPTLKSFRFQPDELGFRGGLAFRLSRIFGLLRPCLAIKETPPPPIGHNVVLDSERVTMVASEFMEGEFLKLCQREMASWKFSVPFLELRDAAALRYCIRCSLVRRNDDSASPGRWRYLTDDFSWRKLRKRFFRPREASRGLVPMFDSLMLSQDYSDYEIPPPYSNGADESGCSEALFEPKKKSCGA